MPGLLASDLDTPGHERTDNHGSAEQTAHRHCRDRSFSHMLNDTMQALFVSMYPIFKAELNLDFFQIGLLTPAFRLPAICACCLPIWPAGPACRGPLRSPDRAVHRGHGHGNRRTRPCRLFRRHRHRAGSAGADHHLAWAGLAWRWHLTTTMLGPRGSMPRAGRPSGTSRSMRNASWPNQHWPGCSPRHTARAAPARITRRSVHQATVTSG